MHRLNRLHSFCLGTFVALYSQCVFGGIAGLLDPNFADEGRRSVGFDLPGGSDVAVALLQDEGGALVQVGVVQQLDATNAIGIARYDFDGYLDIGFGPSENGRVTYDPPGISNIFVYAGALQSDGRILVAGYGSRDSEAGPLVCRFERSGAIDAGFGNPDTPGCRILSLTGKGGAAHAIGVQADGQVMVAGYYSENALTRAFVAQLDGQGRLTEFGENGLSLVPVVDNETRFLSVAEAPGGGIVAVGEIGYHATDSDFLVARFRTDGSLDQGFAEGGMYTHAFDLDEEGVNLRDKASSLAVLANGSIRVSGPVALASGQRYGLGVIGLSASGDIDAGFGVMGKHIYDPCYEECDLRPSAMTAMPDGRLLFAGYLSASPETAKWQDFFVLRLLPNGDVDSSFGDKLETEGLTNVGFDLSGPSSNDAATGLVLQGERVVVGGYCQGPQGVSDIDFCLLRLDHGLDDQIQVTPNPGPHGSLFPNTVQVKENGDYHIFIVKPDDGYQILSISGCEGFLNGDFYTAGPFVQDCSVDIEFTSETNIVLSYAAGPGGSIQGVAQQSVMVGASGTPVTALPVAGFAFKQWSDGWVENPRQDTGVMADVAVTALFGSVAGSGVFSSSFETSP